MLEEIGSLHEIKILTIRGEIEKASRGQYAYPGKMMETSRKIGKKDRYAKALVLLKKLEIFLIFPIFLDPLRWKD